MPLKLAMVVINVKNSHSVHGKMNWSKRVGLHINLDLLSPNASAKSLQVAVMALKMR